MPLRSSVPADPAKRMLFDGIDERDIANPERLFDNARVVAQRLPPLSIPLVKHLFRHSRYRLQKCEAWLRDVDVARATDVLVKAHFRGKPKILRSLVKGDVRASLAPDRDVASPTVLITFHGGFPVLTRMAFEAAFPEGFMIRTGKGLQSAAGNPRAVLFAALRILHEGGAVYVAPDGPFGRVTRSVSVLGGECPLAEGAAFLAFEANARVVWLHFARDGDAFVPVVATGPARLQNETFASFRERLEAFFAQQVTYALTAEPQSLGLTARWLAVLNEAVAASRRAKASSRPINP